MPPKPEATALPAVPRVTNGFKLTTFTSVAPLQAKNVASHFAKSDSQSWFSRRVTADHQWQEQREAKRRRLMPVSVDHAESGSKVLESGPADGVRTSTRRTSGAQSEGEDGETSDPLARTIVIHPGSRTLRIGRASDAYPIAVPNLVARKIRRDSKAPKDQPPPRARRPLNPLAAPTATPFGVDPALPPAMNVVKPKPASDEDELEDSRPASTPTATTTASEASDPLSMKIASVRTDFKSRMRTFNLRGQTAANEQAVAFNRTVEPELLEAFNDPGEMDWNEGGEVLYVGDKALLLTDSAADNYLVRQPYDRGGFNTLGYSSPQELLDDIETLWVTTLRAELGVSREELADYSCILLIPDIYDDVYVRDMTDLMLKTIGFKQACVMQESICATFGAGISTACVVDIGARTTSITCVEDGLVLPETRMQLDFGGDDITQFLFALLMRTGFPYRDADITRWHDWHVLEDLKERVVVMSEADVGLNLYDFHVRAPGQRTRKYKLRVYDDVILASYALFAPRVIDFESKHQNISAKLSLWSKRVDDNISIGAGGLTNAMKMSTRHLLPPAAPASTAAATDSVSSRASTPHTALPAAVPGESAGATPRPGPVSNPNLNVNLNVRLESSKLPLDVAVVESILAAGSEDKMKKICQNLLVVGGTGAIRNLGFAIESRVSPQLANRIPSLAGQVAVVPSPRDIDPQFLSWKGISVLSKLDAANDVWVRQEEWDALGMRAVKERQFFWAS